MIRFFFKTTKLLFSLLKAKTYVLNLACGNIQYVVFEIRKQKKIEILIREEAVHKTTKTALLSSF